MWYDDEVCLSPHCCQKVWIYNQQNSIQPAKLWMKRCHYTYFCIFCVIITIAFISNTVSQKTYESVLLLGDLSGAFGATKMFSKEHQC